MRIALSNLLMLSLLAGLSGCQNPLARTAEYAPDDRLRTGFSLSSDDPSGLETGRGHLPSLASELADRRHDARGLSDAFPRSSAAGVARLLDQGHEADSNGRPEEARRYYEQVLAEDPGHPGAHHRLGILADQAGEFASAERHYQIALESDPDNADLLNDLGYSYFLQGRAGESERFLKHALRVDPRHPRVQENLALLYDRSKAENVLMSLMPARQAQATLARLFEGMSAEMAYQDRGSNRLPIPAEDSRTSRNSGVPHDLDDLKRKMKAARLQSIAERREKQKPRYAPQPDRLANRPVYHGRNLPRTMPTGTGPGREIPDGRINDVFRAIDQRGHQAQHRAGLADYATAGQHASTPDYASAARPSSYPGHRPTETNPVAAAPSWNAQPGRWDDIPPQGFGSPQIQQTHHQQQAPPMQDFSQSAAEKAAEIGLSAGPGAVFPHWTSQGQESPLPAARSLPGTQSRMNGAMYHAPESSHGYESSGNHHPPQDWHGPPKISFEPEPDSAPRITPGVSSRHTPPESSIGAYERMRADENARFNQEQRNLAAHPSLIASGPPAHEIVPGTFDPDHQAWPAYRREQYDTRNLDQAPPASSGQDYVEMPVIEPRLSNDFAVPSAQDFPNRPQHNGRRW